ncbi:hypothetical protein Tco_0605899 [Tanacetum coccineum]
MGGDTIQLETAVSTISQEYLLEFTSEYGISDDLHPELPAPGDRIVDFLEDKIGVYTKFFKFANFRIPISLFLFDILGYYQIHLSQLSVIGASKRVFPTVIDWRESALKDEKPSEGSYSVEDVARLDTCRTPIQKQPEVLLCLVGLIRRYYLGDDVYPTFLYDDGREMDLFNLISAPNPAKIKTGTRPRAAHEVPLLTITTNWVIDMEEPAAAIESSGTPSTIERSSLDFANENPSQQINEGDGTEDQVLETGASEVPPIGHASTTGVAPNIVIEEEDAADVPLVSKRRRKRVNDGANVNAPPKVLRKDFDVSRPAQSTFGGKSFASTGLEAGSTLSAPASQGTPAGTIDPDPLSFAEPQPAPTRDIGESSKGATITGDPNSEKSSSFTSFARSPGGIYQPGWGITNSCRFDTPGACQDAVDHMVPPGYFSELRHLPNEELLNQYNINLARQVAMGSQLRLRFKQEVRLLKKAKEKQVSTLQARVTGEEQIKAAFEEFKKREDDKVERRCAKMDARLDALSIDFDEDLYPHMLTAITGRRWVIGHGLCLAVMKCAESTDLRQAFVNAVSARMAKGVSEGLKHRVEHGKAQLDLEIRELRPSSSQLKILVYPEVRDPKDPWAFKEEMLLEDTIMANASRAEKKKKCQSLAIPLTDVATRTETTGMRHPPG